VSRRSVRDVWHAEVLRTSLVRDACRVLLLHMATACDSQGRHLMTDTGRIRVPRERLAADLGINPKRVTDRITEATRAGLLVKVGGGHNGQVSQYMAQPMGTGKVPGEPAPTLPPKSLAGFVKVPANGGPSEAAEPVPTRGSAGEVGTGRTGTIRARTTEKNREHEPAPDDSRGPEPDHLPTSSSNEEVPSTSTPVIAASPWIPAMQARPAGRWTA
jgi:hypothetical protein